MAKAHHAGSDFFRIGSIFPTGVIARLISGPARAARSYDFIPLLRPPHSGEDDWTASLAWKCMELAGRMAPEAEPSV
jgi:hypothetical protein